MTDARAVALAEIDIPERLRPTDEDWIAAIAESMDTIGLSEPIVVRPKGGRFELVAGAHRLAAAKLLTWAAIPAHVRELDDLEARLVEIDENLMRRELCALDRAIFLAERKRVWDAMHPETAVRGKRKKSAKSEGEAIAAPSATNWQTFSREAAAKLGLSDRLVRQAVQIASSLPPDILAGIRGTYLVDHVKDLEALARMEPDAQRVAVRAVVEGRSKRIRGAFDKPSVDQDELRVEQIIDRWSRLPTKWRKVVLERMGLDEVTIAKALGLKVRGRRAEAA